VKGASKRSIVSVALIVAVGVNSDGRSVARGDGASDRSLLPMVFPLGAQAYGNANDSHSKLVTQAGVKR
jgi:hypothetical protein